MKKVDKSMTVLEALQMDSNIAGILMKAGMHCIFCGAAAGESLQEAGYVHGIGDEQMDEMIAEINDFLANQPAEAQAEAPVQE